MRFLFHGWIVLETYDECKIIIGRMPVVIMGPVSSLAAKHCNTTTNLNICGTSSSIHPKRRLTCDSLQLVGPLAMKGRSPAKKNFTIATSEIIPNQQHMILNFAKDGWQDAHRGVMSSFS
jgi:hypothetical protein